MNKLSLAILFVLFLGAFSGFRLASQEEFNGELNENGELGLLISELVEEGLEALSEEETSSLNFAVAGETTGEEELVILGETNEEALSGEEEASSLNFATAGETNEEGVNGEEATENGELVNLGEEEASSLNFAVAGELNENGELGLLISELVEEGLEALSEEEASSLNFAVAGETNGEEATENGELVIFGETNEEEFIFGSDSSDSSDSDANSEDSNLVADLIREEQRLKELLNYLKGTVQLVQRPKAQIPVLKLQGNKVVVDKDSRMNAIAF